MKRPKVWHLLVPRPQQLSQNSRPPGMTGNSAQLKDQTDALVMSLLLYACESWTLTARRIQAIEMRCLRKLLGITYRDHISKEEVRNRTRQAIGTHEYILTTVKWRKLKWYGHVARSSGLAGHSTRREETEKEMGGQHPGMDWHDAGHRHDEGWEARGMEGAGCQVICGASMVHQTTE